MLCCHAMINHKWGKYFDPFFGFRKFPKRAGIEYRSIKQTRHSFVTVALSCGENPLWIAKVMGHRDTNMIIRVYTRYVENIVNNKDENKISDFLFKKNSIFKFYSEILGTIWAQMKNDKLVTYCFL